MKFVIKDIAKENIICSELKMSEYKELLKSIYGDDPSKEILYFTLKDLFLNNTNKNEEFFDKLSIFELLYVLIEFRVQSLGDYFSVYTKKNGTNVNIDINLLDFKTETLIQEKELFDTSIENENITLFLKSPSYKKLMLEDEEEHLYFLDSLEIRNFNKTSLIKIDSVSEAKKVFDKLTVDLTVPFLAKFKQSVKKLADYNYLKRFSIDEQHLRFAPNLEYFIWFLKLIFNDSLENVYENLFLLSQIAHMSSEYIEKCTPGEYIVFTKQLEKVLLERSNSKTPSKAEGPPMSELNNEFSFTNL